MVLVKELVCLGLRLDDRATLLSMQTLARGELVRRDSHSRRLHLLSNALPAPPPSLLPIFSTNNIVIAKHEVCL